MACKFKYHINGVESKLYTELYGYMDNTNPEKKSVEKVYKILEDNAISTVSNGSRYIHTFDVPSNLKEIDVIRMCLIIEPTKIEETYPFLIWTAEFDQSI